jgi:hypothetical protein
VNSFTFATFLKGKRWLPAILRHAFFADSDDVGRAFQLMSATHSD